MDSTDLYFAHIDEKDIPIVQDLAQRVWPNTYKDILSNKQIHYMMDKMYSKEALSDQFRNGFLYIVAYRRSLPVGFASYSAIKEDMAKLHRIYILQEEQGKGTGRKLLFYIEDFLKTKSFKMLILNVNRHNKARYFYENLGYKISGMEDIDIGNGYFMNDFTMSKDLV